MLDAEGYITTWNLGAQRIKGYQSEEIIGEHFSIFYTDEDVECGHPEEELRVAAADGSYEEEGIRVRKDASRFWASMLITALRNEEGDLRGFAKVTRDITARKVAEERERLLASEQAVLERATDILESISDAFFAVDEEWRLTYINGKAEQFCGRSQEELLGKNIWEEFPRAVGSEYNRQIQRAMEDGVTTEFEATFPVQQVPLAPLGEIGTQVSRIIQEALTNVRRHSEAMRVSVSVKMDRGDLLVEVSDDGRGFGPERSSGVGLSSMRERAALIGGELEIESEVEQGTRVRLRTPLPQGVLE